jgi:GAF domain-containing protein
MKNNFDRLYTVDIFKKLNYNKKKEFQDIADLAAEICGTPVALITLLDEQYNNLVVRVGLDIMVAPADTSFCQYTIMEDNVLVIPDTHLDDRFTDNPLVNSIPAVRFYAGAALKVNNGHNIGSLCVLDVSPKMLTPLQQRTLEILSRQVTFLMELELSQKLLTEQLVEIENHNTLLMNISNVQSHEFRGPVASLLGIMNIIREEDYIANKDYLLMMDETIKKLDEKIHLIVEYTQIM